MIIRELKFFKVKNSDHTKLYGKSKKLIPNDHASKITGSISYERIRACVHIYFMYYTC